MAQMSCRSLLDVCPEGRLEQILASQDAASKAALRSTCSTFRRLANRATAKLKLTPDSCTAGRSPPLHARFSNATELHLDSFHGEPTPLMQQLPGLLATQSQPWTSLASLTLSHGLHPSVAAPVAAALPNITSLTLNSNGNTPPKFALPLVRALCTRMPHLASVHISQSAPLSGAAFRLMPTLTHVHAAVDCGTPNLDNVWLLTKLTSLQLALKRCALAPANWLHGLSRLHLLSTLSITARHDKWPAHACGITNGVQLLPALTHLVAPSLPAQQEPPGVVSFPVLVQLQLQATNTATLRMVAGSCRRLATLRLHSLCTSFMQPQLSVPFSGLTQLSLREDCSAHVARGRMAQVMPMLEVLEAKVADPGVLEGLQVLRQVECESGLGQIEALRRLQALDTLKLYKHQLDQHARLGTLVQLTKLEVQFAFEGAQNNALESLGMWLKGVTVLTQLHSLSMDMGAFVRGKSKMTDEEVLAAFSWLGSMHALKVLTWTGSIYNKETEHAHAVMTMHRLGAVVASCPNLCKVVLLKEPLVTAEHCELLMARHARRPLHIALTATAA